MNKSNALATIKSVKTITLLGLILLTAGCLGGKSKPPGILQATIPTTRSATLPTSEPANLPTKPAGTNLPRFDSNIQQVDDLQGLPIQQFFDESYKLLLLRSPQKVSELGLAAAFGMRNDRLDDLSDQGLQESQALEKAILERLRAYELETLDEEERISYEVYHWYLEMQVQGHSCADYKYELTNFLGSYQFNLEQLLIELHPLETMTDAEDYIARLGAVDEQVDGLLSSLRRRALEGTLPPRYMLQAARQDLQERLGTTSRDPLAIDLLGLNVYTHFSQAVADLPGLSEEQKTGLIQAAAHNTQSSFIPAHIRLLEFIDEFEQQATEEAGLWKFPQGEACYSYLLQKETSTSLTAEQIHQLGLQEVERILGEIEQTMETLPYVKDMSMNEKLRMAQDDAGYIDLSTSQGKKELAQAYAQLLRQVEDEMSPYFIDKPTEKLEVVIDENCGAAYYVPGSLDGRRKGTFHSCVGGGWMPRSSMPTIAYHEGIPGHHFQFALAREMGLPLFRNDLALNGFVEGWALYAELLAAEKGMYRDDPLPDLGRLQYELLRAARLVADTGIHAKKWTRQEARAYLNRTLGGFEYEADRYVALPAQATSYKIGMMKILELRQIAEQALGEKFDLAEFHQVLLGNGSLPLGILEQIVKDYIDQHS